jgi:hypothetical protein
MAGNVAKALKAIEVLDPKGRPHALGSAWRQQPVVLAFIRHFG